MLEFVSHDKCNRVLMECHSSEKCIGCSLSIASKLLHCDGSEARRRWRVARRGDEAVRVEGLSIELARLLRLLHWLQS